MTGYANPGLLKSWSPGPTPRDTDAKGLEGPWKPTFLTCNPGDSEAGGVRPTLRVWGLSGTGLSDRVLAERGVVNRKLRGLEAHVCVFKRAKKYLRGGLPSLCALPHGAISSSELG